MGCILLSISSSRTLSPLPLCVCVGGGGGALSNIKPILFVTLAFLRWTTILLLLSLHSSMQFTLNNIKMFFWIKFGGFWAAAKSIKPTTLSLSYSMHKPQGMHFFLKYRNLKLSVIFSVSARAGNYPLSTPLVLAEENPFHASLEISLLTCNAEQYYTKNHPEPQGNIKYYCSRMLSASVGEHFVS